jgi:hypothetical protein
MRGWRAGGPVSAHRDEPPVPAGEVLGTSVTLDIRWVADRIVKWIRYHRQGPAKKSWHGGSTRKNDMSSDECRGIRTFAILLDPLAECKKSAVTATLAQSSTRHAY